MGKSLGINWESVKLMRYEGLTFQQIADKVGCKVNTITVRASREGWSNEIKTTKETVKQMVVQGASLTFQERAQRFNAAMADSVDESLEHAKTLPRPVDWDEAIKKETALEKLTKRGRATYGLDQAGPSTVVNVAIMGEVLSNPATDVQAIDVQEIKPESEA